MNRNNLFFIESQREKYHIVFLKKDNEEMQFLLNANVISQAKLLHLFLHRFQID